MVKSTSKSSVETYDHLSIILHWAIAIGIVALAGLEMLRQEFPRGSLIREGLKSIHQPAGTILLLLVILRIGWTLLFQRKPKDSDPRGLASSGANLVHLALYALMLAIPLVGLVSVFSAGRPIDFGLFQIAVPLKATLGGLAKGLREVHETLAFAILSLAGLHSLAALIHHVVLRDDTLRRMLPSSLHGQPSNEAGRGEPAKA